MINPKIKCHCHVIIEIYRISLFSNSNWGSWETYDGSEKLKDVDSGKARSSSLDSKCYGAQWAAKCAYTWVLCLFPMRTKQDDQIAHYSVAPRPMKQVYQYIAVERQLSEIERAFVTHRETLLEYALFYVTVKIIVKFWIDHH